MAAAYLEEIKSVQPEGPYRLGGWSLGGAIAYEMASQLAARGERVASLVLVDAELPSADTRVTGTDESTVLALCALDMAALTATGKPAITREELEQLPAGTRVRALVDRLRAAGAFPASMPDDDAFRTIEVFKGNVLAATGWAPAPYAGRVVLLEATESELHADRGGWGPFVPELRVERVPGDHYTMLKKPHVEELAARIDAALL
jgi:thioesterase domain-containing protein